jgi:hypothetical protein
MIHWTGPLPAYKYFEPKRCSETDYEEMRGKFTDNWNFLAIRRQYLHGDVESLYQVLVKFFKELNEQFQINPITNLSAPGIAFKTWKQHQLPNLLMENLKVLDLSRTLDPEFRAAYHGGIVDVYRPHVNKGSYYDVNSLYPTAMLRPMPVGIPTLTSLSLEHFHKGEFFGYIEATVKSPVNEYIGLLPISHQGRVVSPIGSFSGFCFSEELRFALPNGYDFLSIGKAYAFQRGENTFKDLILQLNRMKVEAQKSDRPALRNIAKLLMNSMYGQFGMHVDSTMHIILTAKEAEVIWANYHVVSAIVFKGGVQLLSFLTRYQARNF